MSSLFGLDPCERLVFVGEVARGLACQCRCVVCKEPLIARHGMVREHHFAHASGADPCDTSHESMLHIYAKQVIHQAGGLAVPVDTAVLQALGLDSIADTRGWLPLPKLEAERPVQSIRPDLLASTDSGVAVAIEVAYSSFCDLLKVAEFERIGLPALEIDLRRFSPEGFDPNAVRGVLIHETVGKTWLWPRFAEEEPAPAASGPTEAPGCPVILENKPAHLPEEIITFSGRWVSVKQFPSGDIAVKVVRYDPDLVSLVKTIAKANYGRYSPRWQSWNVPRWRAEAVRSELRAKAKSVLIGIRDKDHALDVEGM